MRRKRVQGVVVRVTGHEIWVDVDGRLVPTVLRGRFRQKSLSIHVVAGDEVEVAPPEAVGAQGTIEDLLPRRTWLSRWAGGRDATEKVIVANLDKLFVIVSLHAPKLNPGFLDRVLVSAERGHNDITICLNKIDMLEEADEIEEFLGIYTSIGYPVVQTSAETGKGVEQIEALLTGGTYAFVGQSGVGKTSLLNRIDDTLNLKVRRVADKTGRGRHTTAYSQLYPLKGGYVADTPGMQTFGYPGMEHEDLAQCFPEFREHLDSCRFQPCTHSHEPECEVKTAHEEGAIHPSRYKSYLSMLDDVDRRAKGRW
jgi:ribosome biogenesis GTPase